MLKLTECKGINGMGVEMEPQHFASHSSSLFLRLTQPLHHPTMAVLRVFTALAVSAAMLAGVQAEMHTVSFNNKCGYGTVGMFHTCHNVKIMYDVTCSLFSRRTGRLCLLARL